MIALEPVDQTLMDGGFGPAAAAAMHMLHRYGEAVGALRFIPIVSAHIDGCLYHGQSSLDFARRFVDLGGSVRVPTTLNVAAVDVPNAGWHCSPRRLLDGQSALTDLYRRLGCLPTLTCAPYQRAVRPKAGDDIAWAESNAIVFANSVLGARSDRYGDFTDLCAALTGRVPEAGFHITEKRRATCVFELVSWQQSDLAREIYFACAGYEIGRRSKGRVPLITGLPDDTSEDELKALGSAAASSGATALFHALGITPEALSFESATQGQEPLSIDRIDADVLRTALGGLCPLDPGEPVAAVCLGTPHYSLAEFRTLDRALNRLHTPPAVPIFASTSREIASVVASDGACANVRAAGVRVVVDTCAYVSPVIRHGDGAILTTSAKFAHYGPGNLRRRVGLMSLEDCLQVATTGRMRGS